MSRFGFAPIAALLLLSAAGLTSAQVDPADLVNPMIGTAHEGQTYPAVGMPFAMTQWTPQTRAGEIKCVAPYYAADTRIQGFRGSHFMSGSCTQDYGSVTLMPLVSAARLDPAGRSSTFQRSQEHAHPYRYDVHLQDSGIDASITAAERAGMFRFRFPTAAQQWVAIENNARAGDGSTRIDLNRQEVTGSNLVRRIYAGAGKSAGFSCYFVVRFDRRFRTGGTFEDHLQHAGQAVQPAAAGSSGAYVSFDPSAGAVVTARVGTSFTSLEAARRNLDAEAAGGDFDHVEAQTHNTWTQALSRIRVAGNSPERAIFYTALYHSMLAPRIYSDRDGAYPSFAGGTALQHAEGFTYFCDFSLWDTFRALHPLLTILEPARSLDMVKSLIVMGQQGTFLPIYPAWNSYTSEMIGDHGDAIIADAYAKGIRGFDAEEAFRLMKRNATVTPSSDLYLDGRGRRALASYLQYGYIPLEDKVLEAFHTREQVSRTLEYAYDDFLVGQMAGWLGHAEDAHTFARRGRNYRNVLDPATGFARGRHVDGAWESPFDPGKLSPAFTEGLPFQYTFFVPQDVPGLIELEHGPRAFAARLDDLFAHGYYDHGNEPSHHLAYLYALAGAPARTQSHVHQIMSSEYSNSPAGLAGNDDAGQMSAWYVMSALGFYAVTPGTPRYEIGTPRFDEMTLSLEGGRALQIHAAGAEAGKFYVRGVRINGKRLDRHYLLHEEIIAGGDLEFEMSDSPPADKF